MMTLRIGTDRKRQGLTFIEIIAVITLIAVVTGVAVHSFRSTSGPLRRLSQNLIRDMQGAYHQALRRGEIYRLQFYPDEGMYRILRFEFPPPAPPRDDRDAYREWEEREQDRLDRLRPLDARDRRALTAIDRAEFVLIEERSLPSQVSLIDFARDAENPMESEAPYLYFYPTGEADAALIVLGDQGGRFMSLITDPYSGRVRSFSRALNRDEWFEEMTRGEFVDE